MRSLISVYTLLFVLLERSLTEGLKCLHCNGVLTPLLCERIKFCDSHEVCLTEKYQTPNKEVLYNVGCYPRNSCVNSTESSTDPIHGQPHLLTTPDRDDRLQCMSCCDSDGCNHKPCSRSGYLEVSRGPICYNCLQTQIPDRCSFVKTCERDQVCRIQDKHALGIHYYSTSCATHSDCYDYSWSIFGRRKRQQIRNDSECCTTDFCNTEFRGGYPNVNTTASTPGIHNKTTTHYYGMALDCLDIKRSGKTNNGVYIIRPARSAPVEAYCDMTTDGGGWTVGCFHVKNINEEKVLLSRGDGHFRGNRSWSEFKVGFGRPNESYWIGNENIFLLTANHSSTVYFKLHTMFGKWYNATYEGFKVGPERDGYRLRFNETSYKGTAGDSLYHHSYSSGNLNGAKFSTYDRDNDNDPSKNQAVGFDHAGWWYNQGCYAQLTAKYRSNNYRWTYDLGEGRLQTSVMMVRRRV